MTSHPTLRVPLELVEFERLLSAGHGRAALDLRVHGLRDRADSLRRACLRNVAYDPQIEGDRGPWMMELLDSVGGPGPWMDDILHALPATEKDHDAKQLAQMLDILARRGDERARNVLAEERRRARFRDADDDEETDWVLGPWPPEYVPPPFIGPPFPEVPMPSLAEFEAMLDVVTRVPTDPERDVVMRYLRNATELPYSARAVALLDHEKGAVRSTASRLIGEMKDPRLREEGLRRIRADGFHGLTTSLLMRNLVDGDAALLESLLPNVGDPWDIHHASRAIAELAPEHRGDERWRGLCTWSYERSPCELCRSGAVRFLDELGVASWLRDEWVFDSESETRRLGSFANAKGQDEECATK